MKSDKGMRRKMSKLNLLKAKKLYPAKAILQNPEYLKDLDKFILLRKNLKKERETFIKEHAKISGTSREETVIMDKKLSVEFDKLQRTQLRQILKKEREILNKYRLSRLLTLDLIEEMEVKDSIKDIKSTDLIERDSIVEVIPSGIDSLFRCKQSDKHKRKDAEKIVKEMAGIVRQNLEQDQNEDLDGTTNENTLIFTGIEPYLRDDRYLTLEIDTWANKEDILDEVYQALRLFQSESKPPGKRKTMPRKVDDFIIWRERFIMGKKFADIANTLKVKVDTVRKSFYRIHQRITGEKYSSNKKELIVQQLPKCCSTCLDHPDQGGSCHTLCKDILHFVEQDHTNLKELLR